MRRQSLALRTDTPLVIDTPLGLIEIRRRPRKRSHIEIVLPDQLRAWVGRERAIEQSEFLRLSDTGVVTAKYSLLAPVLGVDGSVIGVETPGELVLEM